MGGVVCLAAILLAFAIQLAAHGGFDHIAGTVVKVESNTLTVKTAKGDVDVKLTPKTAITKSGRKAEIADLKPGTRVIVEVPQGGKERTAHLIKVGVAAKPTAAR